MSLKEILEKERIKAAMVADLTSGGVKAKKPSGISAARKKLLLLGAGASRGIGAGLKDKD